MPPIPLRLSNILLLHKVLNPQTVATDTFTAADVFEPLYASRPASGIGGIQEDATAIIVVYGGEPGRRYILSTTLAYPSGDDREPLGLTNTPFDRTATFCQKLVISIRFVFDHIVSGEYKLRFLVAAEPLAEIAIPIYWLDDL